MLSKKEKKKCLFFTIFILSFMGIILFNISAIQRTTFTNSLSTENLTFTGDENITRYISIYRYADVTSAYINLSGYGYEGSQYVTTSYTPITFNMTFGCNGQIDISPTATYSLEVCLNNASGDISESCITYTSSSYGIGDKFSTNQTLVSDGDYRIKFRWKRIGYIDMDNAGLNGAFDHGENASDTIRSYCQNAHGGGYITQCGYTYNQRITYDDSTNCYARLSFVNPAMFTTADCSGLPVNTDPSEGGVLRWVKGYGASCRVYEGYGRTGGSEATGICSNMCVKTKYSGPCSCVSCGIGVHYALTSCSEGTVSSCPSSLCSYAGDNIEYTSYFTIDKALEEGLQVNLTEDKINSTGNISWFGQYPNNPYIEIGTPDGTYEWNHTGEFNSTFSPNKTSDFSSVINTYLSGCSYVDNYCDVPILFHSDTAGILEYSAIDINYDNYPFVNLSSPLNDSWASSEKTFICDAIDEINLANVTLYVWNSTGIVNNTEVNIITGISNSTNFTITFPRTDTYYWNCLLYNNNSYFDWYEYNYTLNVNIDNPIINLNTPTNNQWLNYKQNIYFNYTPSHSTQTVSTCLLYGNWSGGWHLNQTDNSITEDVVNFFIQNLTSEEDGVYKWTVWCNTSETGNSAYSQSGNYTLNIDTIYPNISINAITTIDGFQTISFNSTEQDLNTISCKYSIFNSTGGIDGENENVSYTCGVGLSHSATVTDYATYNLTIYVIDLANNENSSTKSFVTSPSISGNGGGGLPGEVEKIPTIALKQIIGEKIYNELERAIFYARINTFCSIKKTSQILTIQDFSGDCSLRKSDIEKIKSDLFKEGFQITINDLILFYEKYNKRELDQVYMTSDIIKTYDLFTSVLGIINPMRVNPPRLDRPFIIFGDGNFTIEYVFVVNKKVKECSILSGDFECEVITDNSVKLKLEINDTDFLDKIFKGEMSITSDAEPENIEIVRISLIPRVYNLSYPILGIPAIILLIIFGVLILIFSIFLIVRGRIRKKLKRRKS